MALTLERPLIFFDLETTGTNILKDRIVEISIVKVLPGSPEPKRYTQRVNPEMPIPADATKVHHITDADVAGAPTFRELAQKIADTFKGCDIAGFNSTRFDLPLLIEEMQRAHVEFNYHDANLIDVQNIFHKKEPRNLTAAYKFYCGKDLDNAHSALADTMATYEVFMAQLEKYADLPDTTKGLSEFSSFNKMVDLSGRFVRDDKNRIVINFGKHKGKELAEVIKSEPTYYHWMLEGDFPTDTKNWLMRVYNSIKR